MQKRLHQSFLYIYIIIIFLILYFLTHYSTTLVKRHVKPTRFNSCMKIPVNDFSFPSHALPWFVSTVSGGFCQSGSLAGPAVAEIAFQEHCLVDHSCSNVSMDIFTNSLTSQLLAEPNRN